MLKLISFVVAAALVLSVCTRVDASTAKAPAKSPEDRFSKLDKDGDKKLSLDEFVGKKTDDKKDKATKRFKKLDKDSDSSLTLDEFKAGQKKKA